MISALGLDCVAGLGTRKDRGTVPKFVVTVRTDKKHMWSPLLGNERRVKHPGSFPVLDSRSLPPLSLQYTALMQGKEGHCLPEVLAAWATPSLLELLGTKYVMVSFAH